MAGTATSLRQRRAAHDLSVPRRGTATPPGHRLHAVTSVERESVLADFDRALGKYPAAAEYHDEQRATERHDAA